jgi:hypothetical protein
MEDREEVHTNAYLSLHIAELDQLVVNLSHWWRILLSKHELTVVGCWANVGLVIEISTTMHLQCGRLLGAIKRDTYRSGQRVSLPFLTGATVILYLD